MDESWWIYADFFQNHFSQPMMFANLRLSPKAPQPQAPKMSVSIAPGGESGREFSDDFFLDWFDPDLEKQKGS